jgi:hypothetical protein
MVMGPMSLTPEVPSVALEDDGGRKERGVEDHIRCDRIRCGKGIGGPRAHKVESAVAGLPQ